MRELFKRRQGRARTPSAIHSTGRGGKAITTDGPQFHGVEDDNIQTIDEMKADELLMRIRPQAGSRWVNDWRE